MILKLPIFVIFLFLTFTKSSELITNQRTDYELNLESASKYYLKKNNIPDSVLIKLVPTNYEEFKIYYETTGPDHNLGKTDFFYETTQLIFDKVTINKDWDFYIPSLDLASFADGEYAEGFIENLKMIIELDKQKFCNVINEIKLRDRNPIKYYAELHRCK
ncbi:hypothetical protein [Mangrovimonas xylaniphaga]|uniref:hypothetical protein n=1 Tax=Mangrovimonas xylaniphaga TaxID=1645915 RepID=UPI0006B4512C|nr:hypothetical protein [Mangrovimonas xylaniphaga]